MQYHEYLARVRELGEYDSQEEAAKVTEAVLSVLAQRISPGEVDDLASQLPGPLGQTLAAARPQQAESFGIDGFCRRVAERIGARPRTAEWDAGAVLTALADAVSGGELNQILSRLPSGYAVLFGKADLAG
ncbi:DUF2267 domain-containing protein [Streptomyces caelestis]|jgi:uncharacterized protein (DUF2267 family)|uniref:Uncharacterized protein (DUF2267 family) n=2 Tax=Streptomyces caelestis TaxID=36816 RepID=A0A7W9GYC5_9ACTN|nr:DUF2267 domain-containing protein [Streptomyces caelestis]MBB5792289.1 uncharacterized protein (DUF2267 family) [Streptomyces caelestis]GGW78230.1 hypothetical protein GCM10010320_70450 [Streptomyces caelestis]